MQDARWSVECGRKLFEPVDGDWIVTNTCDLSLESSYQQIDVVGESTFSLEATSSEKVFVSLVDTTVEKDRVLTLNVVKEGEFEKQVAPIE